MHFRPLSEHNVLSICCSVGQMLQQMLRHTIMVYSGPKVSMVMDYGWTAMYYSNQYITTVGRYSVQFTKRSLTRKFGSEMSVATLVNSTNIASFPDSGTLNRTCPSPCWKQTPIIPFSYLCNVLLETLNVIFLKWVLVLLWHHNQ